MEDSLVVCYRCKRFKEFKEFSPSYKDPLAQICDECKKKEKEKE